MTRKHLPCTLFLISLLAAALAGCANWQTGSDTPAESSISTAPIDPASLIITPREWYTDFASPHSCLASATPPQQAEPDWLEPETVWDAIRLGFRLEHQLEQPRLAAEFNWYYRNPDYLRRVSERANRYAYHVAEQVQSRGLPSELALLPIVESAFDPFAYSHGRASGIWQFIPSTGRHYQSVAAELVVRRPQRHCCLYCRGAGLPGTPEWAL